MVAAALTLAACGFRLRGSADVPFDTIYVPNATAGLQLELKRNLVAGSRAKVLDDPRQAQAIVHFLQEERRKDILSLTREGRVREYRLHYRVVYRVHDGKGGEYVAPSTFELFRDLSYFDAAALAKEFEEQLLWRDMQSDLVQQIMRQLTVAKRPAPETAPAPAGTAK